MSENDLQKTIENLREQNRIMQEHHQLELRRQAQGLKPDINSVLHLERLERDHAHISSLCTAALEMLKKVRDNVPKEMKVAIDSLLESQRVARREPTSTKVLKELQSGPRPPFKKTPRDMILAIEDEMRAPVPATLRIEIEQWAT